jgi:hypothetical protein
MANVPQIIVKIATGVSGALGTSGKRTCVYSVVVTCGAAAGTVELHDSTTNDNLKVKIACPANDTRTIVFSRALFSKGLFAQVTGANTECGAEVDQVL